MARIRALLLLVASGVAMCAHGQSLGGSVGIADGGGGSGFLLKGALQALMGLGGALDTDRQDHARAFAPRLVCGIGTNTQWASVVSHTGKASATTYPGLGLMFELGGSLTYRDRVGFGISGAWGFTGYGVGQDTMLHAIVHAGKRAEARLVWLPPAGPQADRQWRIGVAAGLTFQRADAIHRENGPFQANTTVQRAVRPYLAPEIGQWSPMGKDRLELSIRYVLNVDGRQAWTSRTSLGNSTAEFSATDNYFGIVARYHIGFKRKARPVPTMPPALAPLDERAADTLATLDTRHQHIRLRIWDDAEVDGDTVSIFWNGQPVLCAVELGRKPIRLDLDLHAGLNRLRVVAHNEGRVPPNTASCILRRGKGREALLIKTARDKDQVIVFRMK